MIRAPIFVFSDGLLTFESVETAELYREPWSCEAETVAFDVEGQTLEIRPGHPQKGGVTITVAETAANRAELMDQLRGRLTDIAQARPDLLSNQWGRQTSDDDLVDRCRQHYTR